MLSAILDVAKTDRPPLEHSHWDWRYKIDNVQARRHLLMAIDCQVLATNMFITDGPFLETKEHIGGFWILEAADMDEALA